MSKKLYRTARGATLDIEELRAQNEHRVASGNMNVNAKGDTLGPGGTVIERVADRVRASAAPQKLKSASVKAPLSPTETVVAPETEITQSTTNSTGVTEHIDAEGNITVEPAKPASQKKAKSKKTTKKAQDTNEDSSTE